MTYPSTEIMIFSVLFLFLMVTGVSSAIHLLATKKTFGAVQTKSAKVTNMWTRSFLGIKLYYVELKIPNTKIVIVSKKAFKTVEIRADVLIETQAVYFEPRFKSVTVTPAYYRVNSLTKDSKIILKSSKKSN